jgi:hypothetical protein
MTSKSAEKSYTRACLTMQGQKESELLTRITSAGACAHIITYYNFEAAPDGRMFLAMELADQGTVGAVTHRHVSATICTAAC